MDTATTPKHIRTVAYRTLGRKTLQFTLPLVDRLMDFVSQDRYTSKPLNRNIEFASTGLLAAWLVGRGWKRNNLDMIKQGFVIGVALGVTMVVLTRHQKKSSLTTNDRQ